MLVRFTLSTLLIFCFVSVSMAEKNATIDMKIAEPTGQPVSSTFDDDLSALFAAVKGEWKVNDGALLGKELAADKHAAVLNYKLPNRNSIVRFSFKADGSTKGLMFSMNHAKGHLFRVIVTPAALTVRLDKDKKDPESKSINLGTAKGKFAQGTWHTIQIEMSGERVVVQTDNGVAIDASHKKLDTDKPNYRFVMRGESLSIDDLQIWELK